MAQLGSIKDRRRAPGLFAGFFSGRFFAVAVLATVAALSFTLGYFAGRSGDEGVRMSEAMPVVPEGAGLVFLGSDNSCREERAAPSARDDEGPAEPRRKETEAMAPRPDNMASRSPKRGADPEEPVLELAPVPEKPRERSSAPKAEPPLKKSSEEEVMKPLEKPAEHAARASSARRTPPPKQKGTSSASGTQEQTSEKAPPQEGESRTYSVQVGAFKSLSDAQKHKLRFSGKGYNASVYKDKGSDGESIFKVRIGTFSDRKSADEMAAKLKDAEGVSAFVSVID